MLCSYKGCSENVCWWPPPPPSRCCAYLFICTWIPIVISLVRTVVPGVRVCVCVVTCDLSLYLIWFVFSVSLSFTVTFFWHCLLFPLLSPVTAVCLFSLCFASPSLPSPLLSVISHPHDLTYFLFSFFPFFFLLFTFLNFCDHRYIPCPSFYSANNNTFSYSSIAWCNFVSVKMCK